MAISNSPLDWSAINRQYRNTDQMFEVFPIADPEIGDALGIKSWNSVSEFLTQLADSSSLEVYDMYAGHAVDIATYVPDGLNAG